MMAFLFFAYTVGLPVLLGLLFVRKKVKRAFLKIHLVMAAIPLLLIAVALTANDVSGYAAAAFALFAGLAGLTGQLVTGIVYLEFRRRNKLPESKSTETISHGADQK